MKPDLQFFKQQKNIFIFVIIIVLISIILINKFLIKKSPIKIGVATTLTGSYSTSSIQVRDAAVLAAEQINKKGGIKGRRIELIIKDDKLDPKNAIRVDQELIDAHVAAIVGHSYSVPAIKTVPLMNKKNMLMISPTVQSEKLSGLDDNFLRVAHAIDKDIKFSAQAALYKINIKKIAIVYDILNTALSEPALKYFKKEFENNGGIVSKAISFNSKKQFSARSISKAIIQSGVDGVYIITDAIHAALICQHLKINNSDIKIIVHGWAFTDPIFINEGGKAIDKVISISGFYKNSDSKRFVAFKEEYFNRFGEEITPSAQNTYEIMQILFYALSKTNDPKKLKKVILNKGIFEGLDSKIVFDKYGDAVRSLYIMQIQNGETKAIQRINIEELL